MPRPLMAVRSPRRGLVPATPAALSILPPPQPPWHRRPPSTASSFARRLCVGVRAPWGSVLQSSSYLLRPSRGSGASRTVATCAAPVHADDATIYALSSAPGKGGIAVIRISGPACLDIYRALCPTARPLRPRYAALRTLYDPDAGRVRDGSAAGAGADDVLDTAVVLHFPGPRSVTGEDVLELHVHGGPATVKAVLAAVARCGGPRSHAIRYAEPGEFTRRAFAHGRLDLAQVEALGDTLDAATEQQRRAAVRGQAGRRGRTYEAWRARLVAARAEMEALLDFAEDQHLEQPAVTLIAGVAQRVRALQRQVAAHVAAADRSQLLRQGIRLALVGPANAGKSSLMNLVVGREASIVSHEAGTTRDVVEASLDIRGYLCTFADTAGFRSAGTAESAVAEPAMIEPATSSVSSSSSLSSLSSLSSSSPLGAVEAEGIRRARQAAYDADVVIVLASVEYDDATPSQLRVRYEEETLRLAMRAKRCLIVLNKRDRVSDTDGDGAALTCLTDGFRAVARAVWDVNATSAGNAEPVFVTVSCRAAEEAVSAADTVDTDPGGIHALVDTLAAAFGSMTDMEPDEQDLLGITTRQQQLLGQCAEHLDEFLAEAGVVEDDKDALEALDTFDALDGGPDVVLAAEHLRYAADCLARITGRGETGNIEEVLGVIFEKFCIGK